MSLIPFFYNVDPWGYRRHHRGHWDDTHHFGLGITPDEIHALTSFPQLRISARDPEKSSLAPISIGKDGFQVCIDVQQFLPNEITVKTVDNCIQVEGKHEEREDEHGYISRHFVRKYTLPKGYKSEDVVSTLSSDGVLTIKAPPPPPKDALETNGRHVEIQHTGPAHLHVKKNSSEGQIKGKGDGK